MAEKYYIHYDIGWRHIGLLPLFDKKSKIINFQPILIDLSSVKEVETKSEKHRVVKQIRRTSKDVQDAIVLMTKCLANDWIN